VLSRTLIMAPGDVEPMITIPEMRGHECYHCKQWVEAGEPHDCWTTTETALTGDLSEDLREAWDRKSCYFFVRPKRSFLEVCIFLGRAVKAPQVRRVDQASKSKIVNLVQIKHRDEVEAPITDWLHEAYEFCETPSRLAAQRRAAPKTKATARRRTKKAKQRAAKR
jgi:hypothetical protein